MPVQNHFHPSKGRVDGWLAKGLIKHDNCCSLLAGLPLGVLGRLDRVLRSAARLIGRLPKFSPVSAYIRDVLHWLPISQRISYRTAAVVSRCVLGCAPSYLRDLCRPVSDVAARRALRSTTRGELLIPRARLAIKQRRAFFDCGTFHLE